MRSSSSLGSRWVSTISPSTLPGSTIRPTTSTVSSAAAAPSPVSTSSPTPLQFGNGVSGTFRLDGPDRLHTRTARLAEPAGARRLHRCTGSYGRVPTLTAGTRRSGPRRSASASTRLGVFVPGRRSWRIYNHPPGYYRAPTEITGHPDDKWGWAVSGSPCRSRTSRLVRATHQHPGASTPTVQPVTNFQSLVRRQLRDVRRHQRRRRLPERRLCQRSDAVFVGTGGADGFQLTTSGPGVSAVRFNHNWDPYWIVEHLRCLCAAVSYYGNAQGPDLRQVLLASCSYRRSVWLLALATPATRTSTSLRWVSSPAGPLSRT